jgi:rubrerythrin
MVKDDIKTVFDWWNKYKGRGNWRSHREITYDIECAVKDTLKHYMVKQVCEAIDNYALILLNREYRWSYAWPLALFLTRHRPDDKKILQFTRFLGNNFVADDYLTKESRAKRNRNDEWVCRKCFKPTTSLSDRKWCPVCEGWGEKTNELVENFGKI